MTKKSKKNTNPTPVVGKPLVSVLPAPPRRPVVPNRLRMRSRQMPPSGVVAPISTVQLPDLTHKLTEQDELFFRNILNPCDEKSGPSSGSKIPDGTLPNSGINGFREVINVAPPFPLPVSPSAIGGPLWSLIIMKLPTIREAIYLIATDTRDDLSVDDQIAIVSAYNLGQFGIFPDWYTIPDRTGIKCSVVVWSQLRSIPDLKTLFKQVRISKSGFTTFHNAPDLYNQGMLITAQWNCDDVSKGAPSIRGNLPENIVTSFTIVLGPVSDPGRRAVSSATVVLPNGSQVSLSKRDGDNQLSSLPISASSIGAVGSLNLQPGGSTPPDGGSTLYDAEDDIIFSAILSSTGETLNFNIVVDKADGSVVTLNSALDVSGSVIPPTQSRILTWSVTNLGVAQPSTEVELPPLDTQSIIQSTPKAVVYPLKQYNGGYTPLRFWEPVFLMQEANTQSSVQWRRRNETSSSLAANSQHDILDLNFGTAVQACMGMSLAASITIKIVQDIEFVAGDDSPWMGFMNPNINVDTQVISLARAVTLQTPFAYPQTFNSAGILGSLLSQFVSHVPILSNVVPLVGKLVSSIFPSTNSNEPHAEVEGDKLTSLLNEVLQRLLGKKL